jgi:hypothetical protein
VAQPAELAQGRRNPRSPGLPFNGRRLGRAARIGVSGSRRDQLNQPEQAGSEGGRRVPAAATSWRSATPATPGRSGSDAASLRTASSGPAWSGAALDRAWSHRQAQLEPRSDRQVDRRIHLKDKSGGA